MAHLDDSVINLQHFVASLTLSTGALEPMCRHLEESARKLGELEEEAAEGGGGLNHQLEEFGTALDTARSDAREAMADLTQAAADGHTKADQAQDGVEQAASHVDETAQAVLSDLDEIDSQLTNQGFQPLAQSLDESEQELETESHESEQAFTELETAVQGFETGARAAWEGADTELDQALADLSEGESALESEAEGGVRGFASATADLEQACSSMEGEVELIYDALASGVEAQGQEWERAVRSEAQQAAGFVDAGTQQRLEQPAGMVENEALAALTKEYSALGLLLDVSTATATVLEPLAEDLVKSHFVVGQIDELMAALGR